MKIVRDSVSKTLCTVPDYSSKVTITSGTTLTYDVYVNYVFISWTAFGSFKIDGVEVTTQNSAWYNNAQTVVISEFHGFIAKGSKVEWTNGVATFFKV